MGKSKWLLVIMFCIFSLATHAQTKHRYIVHFKNKSGTTFSLDHPEAFLTKRALDRRTKMEIDLDSTDLPVSSSYLQQLSNLGLEVYFSSKWMNAALVQMEPAKLTSVQNLPFVSKVVYAAKNSKLTRTQSTPVIGPFTSLDTLRANSDIQNSLISTDRMIKDGYTGQGMRIAVLDAGFPYINQFDPFEHLFTGNKIVATRDFIGNSGNVYQYHIHGSSVLSTLAAVVTDEYTGNTPDAEYVLCVTEDVNSEYWIEEYNWLFAAEYADSLGVDVITTSLGYFDFDDATMNYTYADMDGETTVAVFAAEAAISKGMIVVASAGNEGNGDWHYITTPSDGENVIAVGAVDKNGKAAGFTSFGPSADGRVKPDVSALGVSTAVFNYDAGKGYITTGNGTSYAAPQIAGMVTGLWQAHPEWTNLEVIDMVRKTASLYDSPNDSLGYGIANYLKAYFENVITGEVLQDQEILVFPNPFQNELNLSIANWQNEEVHIQIIDLNGKEQFNDQIEVDQLKGYTIDLSGMNRGLYFLRLSSGNFSQTLKVIKQ